MSIAGTGLYPPVSHDVLTTCETAVKVQTARERVNTRGRVCFASGLCVVITVRRGGRALNMRLNTLIYNISRDSVKVVLSYYSFMLSTLMGMLFVDSPTT